MTSILIQGWRFIPHSYSIVNQFQCLELLKRADIEIFHEDMPFFSRNWQRVEGLFDKDAERILQAIQKPFGEQPIDAVLRINCSYNLEELHTKRTCVFGTAEWGIVSAIALASDLSLKEAHKNSDSIIITPSNWSREGFIRSGADPGRIIVIPHGVDTNLYKPLNNSERHELRTELGWEGFIFINIGAMTSNKGIHLLLKAFASVIKKLPDIKLVLKGLDSLYPSEDFLVNMIGDLPYSDAEEIMQRLIYIGEALPFSKVAQLYQAADVYVSPYLGEGFNMPVLEAIACGLPVICTKGGPTDDFTTEDTALYIESRIQEISLDQHNTGFMLVPELEHLIKLMITAVERQDFVAQARNAGPKFVAAGFTWQAVVDQLLDVLIPPR